VNAVCATPRDFRLNRRRQRIRDYAARKRRAAAACWLKSALDSRLGAITSSRSRGAREARHSGVAATEDGRDQVRRGSRHALQQTGSNLDERRQGAADAIERVLSSAQITNELSNICPYVPPNLTERRDTQLARNTIGRFIGMGQVVVIESHKRDEPVPGCRFAFSDTHELAMQVGASVAWLDSTPTAGSGTMAA